MYNGLDIKVGVSHLVSRLTLVAFSLHGYAPYTDLWFYKMRI